MRGSTEWVRGGSVSLAVLYQRSRCNVRRRGLRHFVDGYAALLESGGQVLLEFRLLNFIGRALQVADVDVLDTVSLNDLLRGLPTGRGVERSQIGLARALGRPRSAPLVFVPHPT